MAESILESNLNIKVYEYTLDNYPNYPIGHDVRMISVSSSEIEDCNQITTEEHDNVEYLGTEDRDYIKKQKNEEQYKRSLNTKLCDPITGKLLVTKMKTPIESIPYVDIRTDPKSYSELNFSLDGIELPDILYFNAKFGAKYGQDALYGIDKHIKSLVPRYISKEDLGDLKTMNKLYNTDYITKQLDELNTVLKEEWVDLGSPSFTVTKFNSVNNSLIKMIKKSSEEKFIIFGDFHGGFSTLVRHLMRFRKLNYMDENCIICPGYNIIFLGDLVDRGRFGFETSMFVLLLKKLNPDRVFVNRGNHEELDQNSKLGNEPLNIEMFNKFKDLITFNKINETYSYLSSAIIIKKPKKIESDSNKYIYLAHGGYPISRKPSGYELHRKLDNLNEVEKNIIIPDSEILNPINSLNSIRWSDFTVRDITIANPNRGYDIGKDLIKKAREKNIILTIRGHEDQMFNTKFIARDEAGHKKFDDINTLNPNNLKLEGAYNMDTKPQINCVHYSHSIKLDIPTNADELIKFNINGATKSEYIPVLTISNNTDLGRDLFKDSFIILDFSDFDFQNLCHLKGSKDEASLQTASLYFYKILPLMYKLMSEPIVDEAKRKTLLEYLSKYYRIKGDFEDLLITGMTLDELNNTIYNVPLNINTFGINLYLQLIRNKLYDIPIEIPKMTQSAYGPVFVPLTKPGGNKYYKKYLKYKAKYLNLKKLKNY